MMRIRIEILPHSSGPARQIACVDVSNVTEHELAEFGNYEYEARIEGTEHTIRGRLEHYLRQHGAIRLAARILGLLVTASEKGAQTKP